jgi:hypothetical protein
VAAAIVSGIPQDRPDNRALGSQAIVKLETAMVVAGLSE